MEVVKKPILQVVICIRSVQCRTYLEYVRAIGLIGVHDSYLGHFHCHPPFGLHHGTLLIYGLGHTLNVGHTGMKHLVPL